MKQLELQTYQFGEMKLTWLRGADKYTDAGTLYGPVPKVVWSRTNPTNEMNMMVEYTDPILIQYDNKNYLIEASFDTGKLDDKQRRNLGIISESRIDESLSLLGLSAGDITDVLMTHMHHDHSGGLTRKDEQGNIVSRFFNATIHVNEVEWEEMQHPNKRTRGTYLPENCFPIAHQVKTFKDSLVLAPGLRMEHTGGHSNGHSIVLLEQQGETLVYMADLLVSHTHMNPLWVPAVDDYPMQSIAAKEKWLIEAYEKGYTFFFYHDQFFAMLKFDKTGKEVIDYVPRLREPLLPFTPKQDKRIQLPQ